MFDNNSIASYVLASQFLANDTPNFLLKNFRAARYRDATHVDFSNNDVGNGEAWVFDYGVVIFWGVPEHHKQDLLQRLEPFLVDPINKIEIENYTFTLSATNNSVSEDNIALHSDNKMDRLAVSHALAQSVKLARFEVLAQQVISDNAYIPKTLANKGRTPLSRKALAQLRGRLFSTKSDIILKFNLLDTPEFFWDHPELEPLYQIAARYFEVVPRTELLNKKLETIHELLEMLASEQNHAHSSKLEWIIIILIAVEIVLAFWH